MNINSELIIDNRYRSDIDGLRAIAVLFVIAFHSFPNLLKGGFIGVDIFFVISGYLISQKIYDELENNKFNLNEFYKGRIIRIFPALILVLFTSVITGWIVLFFDEYKQFGKHAAAGAGFISNIVYSLENGYFENAVDTKPLLHLWSLGIEEQFYIVWPFILLFAWKRKFNMLIVVAILGVISFTFNIIEVNINTVKTFYQPQTRFWELISGSLLVFVKVGVKTNIYKQKNKSYIEKIKVKLTSAQYGKHYVNTLSILGFLLLLIGLLNINSELNYPGIYAILPVMATLLIIAGSAEAWINKNILSNKVMVWLGLISYPLYLWHWPLLSFTRIIEGIFPDNITRISIILASIFLAWITFEYIERPIRSHKNSKFSFVALIVLMIVIWLFGCILYIKNGYPNREFEKISKSNLEQLNYTFPSTNECRIAHSYAISSCFESDNKYKNTISIIGDSHMEVLTYGFKKLFDLGLLEYNIIAIGKGGCNPFINTDSITFEKKSYGCTEIITPAIKEMANRKDVEWIILVGRHAARFNGSGYGDIENEFISKPWTYIYSDNLTQSKNNIEAFELGLKNTIDFLDKSGKKIIFVHQIPELGFDIRGCLNRVSIYKNEKCNLNINSVYERLSTYKNSVNQIINNNKNVLQFDPMHIACNLTSCEPFDKSGILLYRDDNHVSKHGAEIISANIIKMITINQH